MKHNLKRAVFLSLTMTLYLSASVNCAESEQHKSNLLYIEEEKKIEAATALLNNSGGTIPLKNLEKRKTASISIGSPYSASFTSMLRRYAPITPFSLQPDSFKAAKIKKLNKMLKEFNTVIILAVKEDFADSAAVKFLNEIQKKKDVILCITGESSILQKLVSFKDPIVISETSSDRSASFCAQAVFGGVSLTSRLAAGASPVYIEGSGYTTTPVRLKYTVPEDAGINCGDLSEIDSIMDEAIKEKATPGGIIMVVKDGKVILEKGYGYHTYKCESPVKITDIYDIASITKVASATISVMRLYEQGRIELDGKITSYIREIRKTDKKNITLRDLLLHRSGLDSFIPYTGKVDSGDYRKRYSTSYCEKIADRFFLEKDYFKKKVWPKILKFPSGTKGKYIYSDLGMVYVKEIIERQAKSKIDSYIYSNFFKPLGLQAICYKPREKIQAERIVPTEIDSFRNATLCGYVHDRSAAVMGGVACHSGLFSDANSLAVLFQMLLNRGSYGGTEFFKKGTVETFTVRQQDKNRRSLGFDGWDPDSKEGYPSSLASCSIFGHTGFTGTCVWGDPEHNLIYIFLSNRTYPNTPNRLAHMNIRSRILDVIYKAIDKENTSFKIKGL